MAKKRSNPPSPDDALQIDAAQYQRNRLRDVPQAALDEYMGLACALGLPPLYREVETEIFPVVRKWCPGMTKAEWSKMEYVERVPYLRRALAALEAPAATTAPPKAGESPASVAPLTVASKEALALALLADHPEWSDAEIARKVPCHRTSLYRFPKYKLARELLEQGRMNRLRGSKSKDGNIEAWEDD